MGGYSGAVIGRRYRSKSGASPFLCRLDLSGPFGRFLGSRQDNGNQRFRVQVFLTTFLFRHSLGRHNGREEITAIISQTVWMRYLPKIGLFSRLRPVATCPAEPLAAGAGHECGSGFLRIDVSPERQEGRRPGPNLGPNLIRRALVSVKLRVERASSVLSQAKSLSYFDPAP